MNLESTSSKKSNLPVADDLSMDDFDFKPITSGLGFHHSKPQDVKPVFLDKVLPTPVSTPMNSAMNMPSAPNRNKDMQQIYQNDLSIFYGANQQTMQEVPAPVMQEKVEKVYPLATKTQRVLAFIFDLFTVAGILGIVLTIMARTISMDLMEVWTAFPNEITPLVIVLFAGFYLIYFSIFEKAPGSTIGKNVMGLRVVNLQNGSQGFGALMVRSFITLINFLSFGLFAWFDLQNKITSSKVIRVN